MARPRRSAVFALLVVILAGCGSNAVPEGFPEPRPSKDTPGGCPDLRGRYAKAAMPGSAFGWAQTPLLGAWRIDPVALEILANDRDRLQARWVFAPEALDAAARALNARDPRAYALWQRWQAPDERARRIAEVGEARYWSDLARQGPVPFRTKDLRGVEDFVCEDGWLVLLAHPPTGDTPPRRIALARDAEGGLVARVDEVRDTALPTWGGDGARSLPLGQKTFRDWARWPAHPPVPAWTPDWTVLGGVDPRFVLPAAEVTPQPAVGTRDRAGRWNPWALEARPSGLPAPAWQVRRAEVGALADASLRFDTAALVGGRLRVTGEASSPARVDALLDALASPAGDATLRSTWATVGGVAFEIDVPVAMPEPAMLQPGP